MHSAMSPGRLGAAFDVAAAAAEHRPAGRNGSTSGRSVRGVRAPVVVRPEPHVSVIAVSFRDTSRARRGRPQQSPLKKTSGK
jgi:hypothetical protein